MFKGSGKMLSAAVLMDWEKKGRQGKSVRRVNATWVGPRIVRCSVTLPLSTQVLLHDPLAILTSDNDQARPPTKAVLLHLDHVCNNVVLCCTIPSECLNSLIASQTSAIRLPKTALCPHITRCIPLHYGLLQPCINIYIGGAPALYIATLNYILPPPTSILPAPTSPSAPLRWRRLWCT